MQTIQPSLGVLNLERGATAGDSPRDHSIEAFQNLLDFPIIAETVTGAWADNVIRGDAFLEPAFVAAAQRLVDRGAAAITANCGYSVRHQDAIAAAVGVPVATTSLIMLPLLLRQLPKSAKIAVIAADSTCLHDEMLGVQHPDDRARVVIGGIEDGILWRNEMVRPAIQTSIEALKQEVTSCVAGLRHQHPEIGAILFECTLFPLVADAVRKETGLPVYDITTLSRLTFLAAT